MSNPNFQPQSSNQNQLKSAPKSSSFNTNFELLKIEMYNLRQLDLSLLQQLWALNESINEFRLLVQEQEENASPLTSIPNSEDNSDEDKASLVSAGKADQKPPKTAIKRRKKRHDRCHASKIGNDVS